MLFTKQEAIRKVELSPDLKSLQIDMNILKTIEKGQEKHEKHIQSLIESVHALVSRSGYQRKFLYHKWSLTICDGCFDTSKSSKMRS